MTQTPIVDWPVDILRPNGIQFSPRGMVTAGPVSITGRNVATATDAGYWIATMGLAILDEGNQIRTMRALQARLEGGAVLVRVPAMDQGQAPWPTGDWETNDGLYSGILHADDTLHSDDTGYHQDSIDVVLAAEAAYRASSIQATINRAGTIWGGELFSINDRLHTIKEILVASLTTPTWAIWPLVREARGAGFPLRFDAPTCRMRLMKEDEMDFYIGLGWQSQGIDIGFVEVMDDDLPPNS